MSNNKELGDFQRKKVIKKWKNSTDKDFIISFVKIEISSTESVILNIFFRSFKLFLLFLNISHCLSASFSRCLFFCLSVCTYIFLLQIALGWQISSEA